MRRQKKKDEYQHSLNITLSDLSRYAAYYRENAFVNKMSAVARSVGKFAIEQLLVLYYALQSNLTVCDKLLATAALGYFVLPFDFIPDFLGPVIGFADDFSIIAMVINMIGKSITPAVRHKAHCRAQEIFHG